MSRKKQLLAAAAGLLAVIVLVPVAALFDRVHRDGRSYFARWTDKKLWKTGILCGLALFVASGLQQMGMVHTDPGNDIGIRHSP